MHVSHLMGRAPPRRLDLKADCAGGPAVEFALVLPMLLLLLIGMIEFGLTLNNYIMLTEAVRSGARQFAISRGGTTPYTDAVNQIYGAAAGLDTSAVTITLSVAGTNCTSDTLCQNELATNQGQPAKVVASYPCNLTFLGFDFYNNCTLSSQTTELVE
jgi:Flp pilus assembly protein TadG